MRALLLISTLLLASQVANAATITYQNVQATGWPGDATPDAYVGFIPLSQFDPALGTLTGATYSVTGDLTFTVANSTQAPINGEVNDSILMGINGPGLTSLYSGSIPGTFANWDDNTPGAIPPGTTSHNVDVNFSRVADLSLVPLIGTGTFDALFGISEDSNVCRNDATPDGSISGLFCGQTEQNFTTSITYSYDPTSVPEPLSAGLLFAGVGGLGLVQRRRKARAHLDVS